jgi:hypothetical protein
MKFLRKENIMCFRTKVSLLMLALFIGAGVFSISVKPAEASTIAELEQIIEDLKAQITELQSQLAASQQGDEDTVEWCHTFRRSLRYGSVGPEVRALQTALEKEELYEAGKDASGRFAMFTSAAVVAFQEEYAEDILAEYGLTNGTGFVGRTTRAKLNVLYGCAPGTSEPPELPESSESSEPPVSPVTRECTDSDGGMDKYVKGTACRGLYFVHPNLLDSDSSNSSTKKSFTRQFCRTDRCIARNIMPKQNFGEGMPTKLKTRDAVKEYYCRGGKIFSKIMYCEDGCYDGACLGEGPAPTPVACAAEGESVVPGPGASDCCEGLSKISCAQPDSAGVCPTGPCVGSSVCAYCPDGTCGLGENKCNCPEDCTTQTQTCSDLGGYICSTAEDCAGSLLTSASDSDLCCDEECTTQTQTCSELGGYICSTVEGCQGSLLTSASDSDICCDEECVVE